MKLGIRKLEGPLVTDYKKPIGPACPLQSSRISIAERKWAFPKTVINVF